MEKSSIKESTNEVHFTAHQLAVIRAWSDYETAPEAAVALGLKENTFKTHLKRMRGKLQVSRTFDVYKHLKENSLL